MPTIKTPTPPDVKILDLNLVTALLLRHHKIEYGVWEIAFEYNVAFGSVGPNEDNVLPGMVLGIKGIGISPATPNSKFAVDAKNIDAILRSKA